MPKGAVMVTVISRQADLRDMCATWRDRIAARSQRMQPHRGNILDCRTGHAGAGFLAVWTLFGWVTPGRMREGPVWPRN